VEDLIISGFDELADSFLVEFRDNRKFDIERFNLVTKYIFDLQGARISSEQHLLISVRLWDLSLTTVHLIGCHYNNNDVFKISNFGEDDDRQIHSILYYISNWFSYKKAIDYKSTIYGSR
jgi:hypothetical protein